MINNTCALLSAFYIEIIKYWRVAWLFGDHLLLGDFGNFGILFIKVCRYYRCHGDAFTEFLDLWVNAYNYEV
jgi:hypothetical protein